MQVRFWGTRGSIAKPGPDAARYGGNTSCVELRSPGGSLIVIDCGTGAHGLGQALVREHKGPVDGHMLISHTHWDHIQGFPFFAPLFVAGSTWNIYGPNGLSGSIREALSGQMQHTYFPITLEQFAAKIRYHDLVEGSFTIGDIEIATRYLNHPALTLAYRFHCGGASVVYCCDHEPHAAELASGVGEIAGHDRRYAEFIAGADLVIHDAQYTARDFPAKIGWGHSSVEYAARICEEGGVRRLVITHYDPLRSDADIDAIVAGIRDTLARRGSALDVVPAVEGETLSVAPRPGVASAAVRVEFPAVSAVRLDAQAQAVLLHATNPQIKRELAEAIGLENLPAAFAESRDELVSLFQQLNPALVLLAHAPPATDGIAMAEAIRSLEADRPVKVPIVVLVEDERLADWSSALPTEWLVTPFSQSYLRTKIRAWVMRTACRWVRARLPADEAQRIDALRELAILDSDPEPRFDRITRIAASAFNVPIALVSLVDAERQWFKSCYGLDARETPRDLAFCAHVVHQRSDLIVPDTLLDDRFADNPLVLEAPRIRFYAGAPLILPDGSCVGTLCLIDTRPRQLDAAEIDMLHDMRDLVLEELNSTRG